MRNPRASPWAVRASAGKLNAGGVCYWELVPRALQSGSPGRLLAFALSRHGVRAVLGWCWPQWARVRAFGRLHPGLAVGQRCRSFLQDVEVCGQSIGVDKIKL